MSLVRACRLFSIAMGTILVFAMLQVAYAKSFDSLERDFHGATRMASAGSSEQDFILYVPSTLNANSVILVDVHGISRNISDHVSAFIPLAEMYSFILISPVFTEESFDDYQRLGRSGRGRPADLALMDMISETRAQFHIQNPKVLLFGYSGGGQFVHRFAMAYPDWVSRVVVGAAGWYTMPTETAAYPYGTGATTALSRVSFDPNAFLNVPMQVLVGDQDVKRSSSLNRSIRVDARQGRTRLDRARNWVAAMNVAAAAHQKDSNVTIGILPGGTHSFTQNMRDAGMGQRIVEFFFGSQATLSASGG